MVFAWSLGQSLSSRSYCRRNWIRAVRGKPMGIVLVAQILLRQLRQGQVVGQAKSLGHCRKEAGRQAPWSFCPGWGCGGGAALLRLVCDKHGERWRAGALEGRSAGGPERWRAVPAHLESVWGEWVPARPTPHHRLAKSHTELMRLNINKATLLRLRPGRNRPIFRLSRLSRYACAILTVACSTWTVGCAVRRLCGAEGGGGGGWGSLSARVRYLGTPLTHSVINQRTVSPISPPPHHQFTTSPHPRLTQAPLPVIFPTCHRLIPSHQPNRDAPV